MVRVTTWYYKEFMFKFSDKEILSLHPEANLEVGSFVLYRNEVAKVQQIGVDKKKDKLQIKTENENQHNVRLKDIQLLSNKMEMSIAEITQKLELVELEEGWKLLQEMGPSCSLLDIAEAVFSGGGPCELYNAFCLLNATPYFKGRPDKIIVRNLEEVQEEQKKKFQKQREAELWQQFYQHYRDGTSYEDEDLPFIQEIEEIAFGERQTCRLFREIKLESTPENAHGWLLNQKLWDKRFNPYLRRNQIVNNIPCIERLLDANEWEDWRYFLENYSTILNQHSHLLQEEDTKSVSSAILKQLEQILAQFCDKQNLQYSSEPGASNQCLNNAGLWRSESRRDLTHLAAWAIDDAWSNDPDDAISLEQESDTLWVHIADPASLIPFGSSLANEAMHRGATIYIPEGSTPMLPKEIVQALGLGLQAVSMALSFHIKILTPKLNNYNELTTTVEILELCRSWVRVKHLSYEQVDKILSLKKPHPLQKIWQLCQAHEQLRQRNYAIQFNMYNIKITAGKTVTLESLANTASRDLVAETMLMTGSAIALFAHKQKLPIPFLCQAPPLETLPSLDSSSNMFLARRLMSPSVVRSTPYKHSGIGVPMYTRGTSPLRRYLDLLTHQQLHAFLMSTEGYKVRPLNEEELLYSISQAEMNVSRLQNAQRCSQKHWQLLFLEQEGKKVIYKGFVLDIRNQYHNHSCKVLCSIPEIGLETLIFSKKPLELNQEVELRLKSVQLNIREAHFQLLERD